MLLLLLPPKVSLFVSTIIVRETKEIIKNKNLFLEPSLFAFVWLKHVVGNFFFKLGNFRFPDDYDEYCYVRVDVFNQN